MLSDEQRFQIARSNALDAFADLETAVLSMLYRFGGDVGCSTRPLAQKLDSLDALKPSPKLPKKRKAEIAEATAEARALLTVRADIVHSRMHILPTSEPHAIYLNVAAAHQAHPLARMMTAGQLESFTQDVLALAGRLQTGA